MVHRYIVELTDELKGWKKDEETLMRQWGADEQESCEDAISRQAVLDQTYLWSKDEFLRVTNPFDYLRKRINALPPVTPQPKTGWIPVSERLPENHSRVLTTIQVPGREPHARSGMYFNGLFSNDNGDVWKATDEEVKAWMPLPEPYKAESEVQDAK